MEVSTFMEIIKYKNKSYPSFHVDGNATQYALPFAKKFCKGFGLDIGCNRQEWCLPGAIGVDKNFDDGNDAYNFSYENLDFIYSSHCLEHLPDWVGALDYWTSKLKIGGILFLYLPHYDQEYWRPWNNRKHFHAFVPKLIVDYLKAREYINIFHSERDLLDSFMVVGEKS